MPSQILSLLSLEILHFDEVLATDQGTSAEFDTTEIHAGFEYAYLVGTEETRNTKVDLYDSGATQHMSGYFHRFTNFINIEPIPITAQQLISEHFKPKAREIYISTYPMATNQFLMYS